MSAVGSTTRPIGLPRANVAAVSGLASATRRYASLCAPGQMTLQQTWRGAHSRAAVRVRVRSASLAALYCTEYMCALTPLSEHRLITRPVPRFSRSEEHTSELQSRFDLVCRLLLEKKKRS